MRIVDKENLIKLIVVTKRVINKGEILALDKNLIFRKKIFSLFKQIVYNIINSYS